MCYIRHERTAADSLVAEAKILRQAKTDLTVWKILDRNLRSIVKGHQYEVGRTYRSFRNLVNLIRVRVMNDYEVEHGFHAYTDLSTVKTNCLQLVHNDPLVVRCTIPAGALYYWDDQEYGEAVSSSIRVDGILQPDGTVSAHNPKAPSPEVIKWINKYLAS
jgi:hypothetical protein